MEDGRGQESIPEQQVQRPWGRVGLEGSEALKGSSVVGAPEERVSKSGVGGN